MKKILSSATRICLLAVIFTACYLAIAQIPVSEQFQAIAQGLLSFFCGMKAGQTMTQQQAVPPQVIG